MLTVQDSSRDRFHELIAHTMRGFCGIFKSFEKIEDELELAGPRAQMRQETGNIE